MHIVISVMSCCLQQKLINHNGDCVHKKQQLYFLLNATPTSTPRQVRRGTYALVYELRMRNVVLGILLAQACPTMPCIRLVSGVLSSTTQIIQTHLEAGCSLYGKTVCTRGGVRDLREMIRCDVVVGSRPRHTQPPTDSASL